MTIPINNPPTTFSAEDYRFMARALQLAKRGLFTTMPNPRVGSVIVNDGRIVGEGWHERRGEAHAEVNALNAADSAAKGGTLYATLEPCCHTGKTSPCTDAIISAGITRVVSAMTDPNPQVAGQGLSQLDKAGITVRNGCGERQALDLNPGFVKRMQLGRPWVRVKSAASLDGKTAMASGESQWITGDAARADVARWRARSCALVTGVNTVLADNPRLTARADGLKRQPLRVVLDSQLRTPVDARLFNEPGKVLVVTVLNDNRRHTALVQVGAEVLVLNSDAGRVDLATLLEELGRRKINEILVESGSTLAGGFAQQQLVDEYVIYHAPRLMGHDGRGMLSMSGITRLNETINLDIQSLRQVGDDIRIVAIPNKHS